MESICIHCGRSFAGNYCNNCGQKAFQRVDGKYIWNEFQYTVLHTNKGFLYSIKKILINPGKTAKEFLDGKRVNHYKPLTLTFILSGISAFVSVKLLGLMKLIEKFYSDQHLDSEMMRDYTAFSSSYSSIIMLACIPLFALCTWLAFKKWGHNYYEHIILNSYILSFYTLINLLLVYPVMFLLKSNPEFVINLSYVSMLLIIPILIWFFKEFYAEKPINKVITRIMITLLFVLAGSLLLILVGIIAGLIMAKANPETLKYVKPQ